MNGIITKVILFLIGAVFLGALVFLSFTGDAKNITRLPDFGESEVGEYVYKSTGNGEIKKRKIDFETVELGENNLYYEKNIDLFTNIYSDDVQYSIIEENEGMDINIGTGTYLINSRNPLKEISINVGSYKINLDQGGMVYVENSGTNSLIVSLNSKVEINFVNEKTKKKGVSIFLYPHMYVGFKVSRLQQKDELDSLRLSQLSTLGYFPEVFSDVLSGNLGKLINNGDFVVNVLKNIKLKKNTNNEILQNNISDQVDNISGVEYIEKYFVLFYNERKKLVYHQNQVLEKMIQLSNNTELDATLVLEIVESLDVIKALDPEKYIEMLNLVNNFSNLAFDAMDNDILFTNFSLLLKEIHGYSQVNTVNFGNDFNRLNFTGKKTFYKKLKEGYDEIIKGDSIMKDYYLYFVRNIILEGFKDENLSEEDSDSLIDILNQYAGNLENVTNAFESTKQDPTKKITNIVYNERILKAIENMLLTRYFGDRNSENLLVRTDQKIANIVGFEGAINYLYKYYTDGKSLLKTNLSKYSETLQSYEDLDKEFEEYLTALKNYSQYQKKYSYKEITVVTDGNDDSLSKIKLLKYMKQFNGINLNGIEADVVEGGYRINNMSIEGRDFSLFLNPYRGNRITSIFVKNMNLDTQSREGIFYNQLGNTTYEMDDEEGKYKKLLEKADGDDIERFDFKNFFKNNFFPQNLIAKVSCKDDIECAGRNLELQNDDELIQLFKAATLLGDKGEFRNVKNTLDVKYSHLLVTKMDDSTFDIVIQDSVVSLPILINKKTELISADFNSNYELEGGHYFSNIVLKPFTKSLQGDRSYPLGSIPLYIKGNIGIESFEKSMEDIFKKLDYIDKEYQKYALKNDGKVNKIEYALESGIVTFQ